MRNSRIWKILAVSIVLVLIGCSVAIITSSAIVSANTLYPGNFSFNFTTDKQRYQCGEPIKMTMPIINRGTNVTLECSDECLFCGFEVNETDFKIVYDFSLWIRDINLEPIYIYRPSFDASRKTEIPIKHNETLEVLNFTWNQVDDHGYPVPYGRYSVSLATSKWYIHPSYSSGKLSTSFKHFIIIPKLPPDAIYVPDNITTIQDAVDLAMEGDTIVVKDGIYKENVLIDKHLTIKSENEADATIIQAANSNNPIFYLLNVDYVNISGFGVTGSDSAGIYLKDSDNCNISNNNAMNNHGGISLFSSKNNTLANNTVSNNDEEGISLLFSSNNNTITNNIANVNKIGIRLSLSINNTLANNTVSNSEGEGICLYSSTNNTICNNNLNYNEFSIKLESSNNNVLNMNTNLNNLWGIHLKFSSNNKISLNNFMGNHFNNVLSINSANIWNSTEEITCTYNGKTYTKYLGNYWDDYKGTDEDDDGIGDTPYGINSDKDNHPLMAPWEKYVGDLGTFHNKNME